MLAKSPIMITHQMLSVITQIDLPLLSSIKISLAYKIKGKEGYSKDPFSFGCLIEGG
jgi:hypothetical protein